MEPSRSPAQLIAESKGLLLDFDGPVCDVYAGSDPARIAREVASAFSLDIDTDDPLELIGHALAMGGPVDAVDQALTETEIKAVRMATETPGIRQLIETFAGPIGVVSNNAREAIETWLSRAGLGHLVDVVVGRDPRRMKPDPRPLQLAAKRLALPLNGCIFVGDSVSDAVAAERAGVPLIALANRPRKWRQFRDEQCLAIIGGMHELTSADTVLPRTE
jgi:HAD superfamily hydrolase (TIGR01509 family)